jgi:hypothetical protein
MIRVIAGADQGCTGTRASRNEDVMMGSGSAGRTGFPRCPAVAYNPTAGQPDPGGCVTVVMGRA